MSPSTPSHGPKPARSSAVCMRALGQLLPCSGLAWATGATNPSDCCGPLQVQVTFDSSLLAVPSQSSCSLGTDWQSAFVCNAKGSNSSVFFNSVDQSVNSAKQGTAVSIATITFQAVQVRRSRVLAARPLPQLRCIPCIIAPCRVKSMQF